MSRQLHNFHNEVFATITQCELYHARLAASAVGYSYSLWTDSQFVRGRQEYFVGQLQRSFKNLIKAGSEFKV